VLAVTEPENGLPPPPPPLIVAVEDAVTRPFPLIVRTQDCVLLPQDTGLEFTVFRVKFGAENVRSPPAVNPPKTPALLI
jgi:hypothetical protein